jgi:uncharacterized protein
MTPLERLASAGAVKVFPLPSVVLFPGASVPLHIFEPRYRELLKDSLASDRLMALAQLEAGWEGSYYGRPPLQPVACVGQVIWHEALTDGRFNLVLQGVARVRLVAELPPSHNYRELEAQVLLDAPYSGPEEEQLRQAVLELCSHLPEKAATSLVQAASRASGGGLADVVASGVVSDVARRQALLCELDPKARLNQVIGEVGEIIARIAMSKQHGPVN